VVRRLAQVVETALRQAIPDPGLSALVGGLFREGVELVGDPGRWRKLLDQGVGFLLSRVVPVVKDAVIALLGRVAGIDASARGVVESFLNAAAKLLGNPQAIADFAKNAVRSLVSLGLNAVAPILTGLVERALGPGKVTEILGGVIHDVSAMLAEPGRLKSFLALPASQALGKVLAAAKTMIEHLVGSLVPDASLKGIAQAAATNVLDFVGKPS
jgi:hypothetical protein